MTKGTFLMAAALSTGAATEWRASARAAFQEPPTSEEPPAGAAAPVTTPETSDPILIDEHRRFLSVTVRRALQDATLEREPSPLKDVPAALRDMEAEAVVRLRSQGVLLAQGAAGGEPIAEACRDAARAAYQSHRIKHPPPSLSEVNRWPVEIEVVGRPREIKLSDDPTIEEIAARVEPGVEGVMVILRDLRGRVCPAEMVTTNTPPAEALITLLNRLGVSSTELSEARVSIFRTQHWYEPRAYAAPVSLTRGLVPVRAVTPDALDRAIETLARYVIYRQQPSGLFSYEYDIAKDRYEEAGAEHVRQAGVAQAIAFYAAQRPRLDAPRTCARLALERHLKGLTYYKDREAAFITTPDGENELGVTALVALALAEFPDDERYARIRGDLVNGMLKLQQPSGFFVTAFPPARSLEAQDYFPGEALLALARHYDLEPSSRVGDAFHRSIHWYRPRFQEDPSLPFVPWQTQAFAGISRRTKREDYVHFVFELTDWAAERQFTADNCPYPELWGGIAGPYDCGVGASAATYLEGFADALELAKRVEDEERVERYERLIRDAARFLLTLQVKPEETYFMLSPRDAAGGIRAEPTRNRVRIDHCGHALVGWMKARRALFGPP